MNKPKKRQKIRLRYFLENNDNDYVLDFAEVNAACFDIGCSEPFSILTGTMTLVKTGLYVRVPIGYVLEIYPRSGLAVKYGLTLINSPAQIDAGYQDEVKLIMTSTLRDHIGVRLNFSKGSVIAQAKLVRLIPTKLYPVESKEELFKDYPNRGGGLGSTGV